MGSLFSPKAPASPAPPPPMAPTPIASTKAPQLEIAPTKEGETRRARRSGTSSLQIPAPGLNVASQEVTY